MAVQLPDLCPEDIGTPTVIAPVTVLRDQAARLSPRTRNAIQGVVETTSEGSQFIHTMSLLIPGIENCKYRLVRVKHGIMLYPVEVSTDLSLPNFRCGTQEDFLRALGEIFSSGPSRKIIHSLIAQSRA